MLINLVIAIAILGLALLIRSCANGNMVETRNPFLIIVGTFLTLYLGAALFLAYRMGAWSAEKQPAPGSSGDQTYVIIEPVKNADLSTGP